MHDSSPEIGTELASETVAHVRDALTRGNTACVTRVLEIVQEMSDKADRLSVQDLADIIGRDLTTVAKIMRAANCLGYNPGAVDVTTLSEAINVIGFETIRNLVISLLLIENAENRSQAHECNDVAAVALSSALTAQVIARRKMGINAEEAFVCAALRHYGKLLFSTFMTEQYREALDLTRELPLDAACIHVFGLTPLELGSHILSETHLPGVLQHALQPVRPETIRSKNLTDADALLVVADFSSKLCELLDTPELDSTEVEAASARLLKQYATSVQIDGDELKEVFETVGRTLNTVGSSMGFESLASPIMNRLNLVAEGKAFAAVNRSAAPSISAEAGRSGAAGFDPLAMCIGEVKNIMATPPVDSRKAFSLTTRSVKAALRLRSCLVFLKEPGGPLYAAVVGSGAFFNEIRNQPLIDPSHKDVFTVCLSRGEDVLIQNPSEPSIAPFIPDWFKRAASSGPLVLLPVKDEDGTFAILCGIAGKGERIELPAARLQQLKELRSHLAGLPATGRAKRRAA